jgi:hypothetical protein
MKAVGGAPLLTVPAVTGLSRTLPFEKKSHILGHGPKCSHRADVVRCSSDSRNIDSAVTTSQSDHEATYATQQTSTSLDHSWARPAVFGGTSRPSNGERDRRARSIAAARRRVKQNQRFARGARPRLDFASAR